LESTAHTFAGSVVDEEREVLSDVREVYRPKSGGIHPRNASRHHYECASSVISRTIEQSGLPPSEIDVVAFSRGPGLGPCLRVGATAARSLSLSLKRPLVGVNHAVAHLELSKKMSGAHDPVFLYVSGGNTQVISEAGKRYVIFGETEDIALGNLLDSFARVAGVGFPGGPAIMRLAKGGKRLIELPYSIKGMNVSFSGTLTILEGLVSKEPIEDLARSVQETCFAMLLEASERAMAYLGKDELVITGGVGANERLREMAKVMCDERRARFLDYPVKFYADNGAMIAWTGLELFASGETLQVDESTVMSRWRVDEVELPRRIRAREAAILRS